MSLEERIIEELEKSGYPLEIKATLTLESRGWNVLNQEGYLDVETNKWRTIDIFATKTFELPNSPIYKKLHLCLAIECKKIDNPWVFWIRDKKRMRTFDPIIASSLIKLESNPWLHPLHITNLAHCFHYYLPRYSKVALISYEPFIKKGKSIIFEATRQVIKFLIYERKRTQDLLVIKKAVRDIISIAYPLIIVDGKLYEMEFKDKRPKLIQSRYIQFLTSHGIPHPENFIIDIVKIDFIDNYLNLIEDEVKKLTTKIVLIRSPSMPPISQTS